MSIGHRGVREPISGTTMSRRVALPWPGKSKPNSCNVFPLFFYIGNIVTRFSDRTSSVRRRPSLPVVVSCRMQSIWGQRNALSTRETMPTIGREGNRSSKLYIVITIKLGSRTAEPRSGEGTERSEVGLLSAS